MLCADEHLRRIIGNDMIESTKDKGLIFGFREESWPKGHGYLYVKSMPAGSPERLCDVDLYDTRYEVVRSLFKGAIEIAMCRLRYSSAEVSRLSVEVENMSSIARTAFMLEMADYIEKNREISAMKSPHCAP